MEERVWHRFYDEGVTRSLDYEPLTLDAMLQRSAAQFPDAPAIVFRNGRLSYRELAEESGRLAAGLAGLGVRKGTKVAVHLPNLPQTVIAAQACFRLGAVVVMTNPIYVQREIEHQWNDAGAEVAITADYLWDQRLRDIRGKVPVKHYLIASIPEYLRFPLKQLAPLKLKRMDPPVWARVEKGEGLHPFRAFLRAHDPAPPAGGHDWDDLAVLQYTGGTTGVSKGAMLTHKNLSCNVQQCTAWFTRIVRGQETVLAALPFFHIFGFTIAMLLPVHIGGAMVLMPDPRDLPLLVKSVARHRVTLMPAVPALFNAVNHYPGIEKIDISSVKSCISGSAPLAEDVQQRFEALTGAKVAEGFGLTETSPVTHTNPLLGQRKIGSIGVPVSDTDAKIVDPDDAAKTFPAGEAGELLVAGPQVMQGYWKNAEETARALRDGWLHTGDLATMDEEGYFRIVGRKKDTIKVSGYNVFPDEIDRILMAHPAVLEACTIGIPDPKRGETPKAFVVLMPGATLTEAELDAYARENLAPYKVPRHWEFRAELPKSAVMKTLRRVLRDEATG